MALPKKKKSRSRRDMRRSHDRIPLVGVTTCQQCHEPVLPHRVCQECGSYRGKTVIQTAEDK